MDGRFFTPKPLSLLLATGLAAALFGRLAYCAEPAAPNTFASQNNSIVLHYPRLAAVGDVEGWVEVGFVVGTDGRAVDAAVIHSEPETIFDRSALKALESLHFDPADAGSRSTWVFIYHFALDSRIVTPKPPEAPDGKEGEREGYPIRAVTPIYPTQAAIKKIEGHATVEFEIRADGLVMNPRVIDGEPEGTFGDAALNAIRGWRFRPSTVDGNPIRDTGRYTFRFRL